MFKQIKSILIWSLIYKFRKRVTLVVLLLSTVLLSQWLYSDIVEYLKLTEQTQYLNYILPIKWIMIFSNIGISTYLVLTLFKSKEEDKKEKNVQKEQRKPELKKEQNFSSKSELSDREKSFLKRKIRSEADILKDK